jgi:MFS family permease
MPRYSNVSLAIREKRIHNRFSKNVFGDSMHQPVHAAARSSAGPAWRSRRYPWLLIVALWCCALLNNADRTLLVAVMPAIRAEFGLSNAQLALPTTVFFWAYAFAVLLTSRFGDRMLRSTVITTGLIFWSLATGMVSMATGFAMLLGTRVLVATGEATYYPSATALISDWHPAHTRGRALSLHQTGVFAGALLGGLAAGVIADHSGWRAPFVVFGVIGTVYGLCLFKLLKDVPGHATRVSQHKGTDPLKLVLANRSALFLCLVFLLATGVANGLSVWAPTFVHDKLHTNLTDSALVGSVTINAAGIIAVPLGGLLADFLARRTPMGRFYAMAIGLAIAGLMLIPLAAADTAVGVGAVLLASTLGKGLFDGCIYAAMHDVIPPEARSTAVGVMTMAGFIGAGLAPLGIALLSEHVGMGMTLTLLAAFYFLAVAVLLLTRGVTRASLLTRSASH